jgi:hypothetical protein
MDVEKQLKKLSTDEKVKMLREIYAKDFHRFMKDLVYTMDEHDKTGNALKKIPYEWSYIQQLCNELLNEPWLLLWKSRQILATWVCVSYCLWIALFHPGKKVAVQSKKSDDADALIQRMKVIYDKLPSWKPEVFFSYCRIKIPSLQSDVFGIASGPDQVRSYTYSVVFSDEFGFQEKLQETFGAVKPIVDGGGQFVACTTPPREKNFSYTCKQNAKDKGGLFKVIEVHYSSRPDRDETWKAKAKLGWSEDDWNRENELQMVQTGVTRVIADFSEKLHVNPKLVYLRDSILYRGWDFGYHRPACAFLQIDPMDRAALLAILIGRDILIDKFADHVLQFTQTRFPGGGVQDFCDPAGTQVNDKSEKTSIQILNSKGIYPSYRKSAIEDGLNIMRRKFSTIIGERPAFQIHPRCQYVIDALIFGYIYGRDGISIQGEGLNEYGEEERDYFKHGLDGVRYIFVNLYTVQGMKQSHNLKNSALTKNLVQPMRAMR